MNSKVLTYAFFIMVQVYCFANPGIDQLRKQIIPISGNTYSEALVNDTRFKTIKKPVRDEISCRYTHAVKLTAPNIYLTECEFTYKNEQLDSAMLTIKGRDAMKFVLWANNNLENHKVDNQKFDILIGNTKSTHTDTNHSWGGAGYSIVALTSVVNDYSGSHTNDVAIGIFFLNKSKNNLKSYSIDEIKSKYENSIAQIEIKKDNKVKTRSGIVTNFGILTSSDILKYPGDITVRVFGKNIRVDRNEIRKHKNLPCMYIRDHALGMPYDVFKDNEPIVKTATNLNRTRPLFVVYYDKYNNVICASLWNSEVGDCVINTNLFDKKPQLTQAVAGGAIVSPLDGSLLGMILYKQNTKNLMFVSMGDISKDTRGISRDDFEDYSGPTVGLDLEALALAGDIRK